MQMIRACSIRIHNSETENHVGTPQSGPMGLSKTININVLHEVKTAENMISRRGIEKKQTQLVESETGWKPGLQQLEVLPMET